jgi:hypothetical protein
MQLRQWIIEVSFIALTGPSEFTDKTLGEVGSKVIMIEPSESQDGFSNFIHLRISLTKGYFPGNLFSTIARTKHAVFGSFEKASFQILYPMGQHNVSSLQ